MPTDRNEQAKVSATTHTEISRESSSDESAIAFYRLAGENVVKYFGTHAVNGLSSSKAKEMLAKYGPNSLGDSGKINYGKILAHQVFNAMILVLIISMIIALAIQDWISGGVIGFVVLLNISVGFIQEMKAEKTMNSLKSLSSPSAHVTRDDDDHTIPTEEVVPGDIVHIRVGDTIPADLRLIDSMNLETDEALLTGESLPIPKDHTVVFADESVPVPLGDRCNMAYSSSVVSKGRGTGVVVATGLNTEIGKIAKSLQGDKSFIRKVEKNPKDGSKPKKTAYVTACFGTIKDVAANFLGVASGTPLQIKLSWLAIVLFWIAVVFAIVVMASQKFRVNKEVAIYAICVALSMIPSALIVVLTITMAVGAQVMVSRNVIVRNLDSLEALGGINDICSDKTGTLTQGRMIAKKVWIPNVGTYSLEGSNEPYNPNQGTLSFCKYSPKFVKESDEYVPPEKELPEPAPANFAKFCLTAGLANIAIVNSYENPETGKTEWKAHGDPTEIAIRVFTSRIPGYTKDELAEKYDHINEFPFDSSIKRMSAIYRSKETGEVKVYSKGAVERLLKCCKYWHSFNDKEYDSLRDSQELRPLTEEDIARIEDQMEVLSREGLRVLAFAYKDITNDENISLETDNREQIESDLIFQGLVGIYDPPRNETSRSVKLCHQAGINVRMLTGDHPGTAKAIAQDVGIVPRNLHHYAEDVVRVMIMTAHEFDKLSDSEIDELPVLPLVIARCAPQTKVRMIEALHRRNKYVAMTGDGVNDSPSLKKADVGVAMGMNGSDVAKDASDIVLTDDNFASILNAIEEGRRMSANIQKFVLQLLAENVAQAIFLLIGLAFMDSSGYSVFPLSPVEILFILVVTSSFPAFGLGVQKAAPDVLEKKPNSTIFTTQVLTDMMVYGIWMAACCLFAFVVVVWGHGDGYLGIDCNATSSGAEHCDLVYRARSTAFATMTWCALILAWECIHPLNSLFRMTKETDHPWWKQTAIDLYENKFLFWSIVGGFVAVFPVVYIPVINSEVFLHSGISWEWGVAFGCTGLYLLGSELWKWIKRVYLRRREYERAKNPEAELEKSPDIFEKYASLSRASTMDHSTLIV
ncbi:hypothetical protein KL918_001565 [Ogataea parapolymorpha]|uniref:P-type Na(+) transporter n=1 Tax=Ogataea parapolymorpha (strain ATCC 26012 / BCRC 20466 / JCM 22074 / NRRL Y-7560 / DL-1) TaxID=871575 RepID=W1QDF3_OGAPD|nr:P-type ATPase involved in Na+ efflux [Ogataea parapolymorpha DL-1]ESW99498.1 P-type ATPase involved in Na+ efflux [Ogataea parapolymorpha DL-1]KAG7868922.1 hypothetical protein KL918_001565 [Ogataea parapolymorpha]KAG7874003.1 hypothetical protein KL916_001777 [Ogataea parapolymorpha]